MDFVGGIGLGPMTSSMSTKRSTTELTAPHLQALDPLYYIIYTESTQNL